MCMGIEGEHIWHSMNMEVRVLIWPSLSPGYTVPLRDESHPLPTPPLLPREVHILPPPACDFCLSISLWRGNFYCLSLSPLFSLFFSVSLSLFPPSLLTEETISKLTLNGVPICLCLCSSSWNPATPWGMVPFYLNHYIEDSFFLSITLA